MKRRTDDISRDLTIVLAWLGATIGGYLLVLRFYVWALPDLEQRHQNTAAFITIGVVYVVGAALWLAGPTTKEGD